MTKYNKNSYRTKRNCKDRKINVGKLTKEKIMHDKSRFNFYNVCNKYNHFKFPKKNEYHICFRKSNHIFMCKIKCTANNWKHRYREQQYTNDTLAWA